MSSDVQSGSPKLPEVNSPVTQPAEVSETPFERWIRLADDLLRDWPHPTANTREHRV